MTSAAMCDGEAAMAEDNGAGWLWGGVVRVAEAAQDLIYELGELDSFKKRIDELLTKLNASEAAPDKVGQDRLARAQLGGSGFREAEFLYTSYNTVHDELENLSKVLGLQIESMQLAVRASGQDYDSLDEDILRRMRTLNAEIEAHYDKDRDPHAARGGDGTANAPAPESRSGDGGTGDGGTSGGYG
ncbi:hypothetical protein [Streptomyces sp. NPDC126933]|uniref:hypothetical protein n=1 Tax=unclassified Streptomyces TaxID=2593676 RepID=UPI003657223A